LRPGRFVVPCGDHGYKRRGDPVAFQEGKKGEGRREISGEVLLAVLFQKI
jgi:hypothetical protein